MADGSVKYMQALYNKSGYILLYPGVGAGVDLREDAVPPNPYAQSSVQQYPLGTKAIKGIDGFWYCKNAAVNLNISEPLQSAAAIHAEADDNIVVGATSAIGVYTVTLTSTTNLATSPLSTANGFAEGYIFFHTAAGEGQCYQIKSHTAASGTSNFVVTLYDPLTIALTASSRAGIIQNPCANVLASKAVVTGIFAGIPQLDVTASYYFWAKMAGPSAVVENAAIAKGTKVVIGTTAARCDPAAAVTTEIAIGYPLTPATTTDDERLMVMLSGNW